MLVNAYAAETLAVLIFFFLPWVFGFYVTAQKHYYSSLICECLIMLSSLYPMVLFLTIIAFIKPYRQCLRRAFWKVITKLPLGIQAPVDGPPALPIEPRLNLDHLARRKTIATIIPTFFLPQYEGYI